MEPIAGWQCPCQEKHELQFDTCWNCGASRSEGASTQILPEPLVDELSIQDRIVLLAGEAIGEPYYFVAATFVGGRGLALTTETDVHLVFSDLGVAVVCMQDGIPTITDVLPVSRLSDVEVTGPGTVSSDAGVMAVAGFGLRSTIKNLLGAAVINRLTRTSSTTTVLALVGEGFHATYLTEAVEPDVLKIQIGPLRSSIKNRSGQGGGSLASELQDMAQLYEKGLLSDAEFQAAKERILGGSTNG